MANYAPQRDNTNNSMNDVVMEDPYKLRTRSMSAPDQIEFVSMMPLTASDGLQKTKKRSAKRTWLIAIGLLALVGGAFSIGWAVRSLTESKPSNGGAPHGSKNGANSTTPFKGRPAFVLLGDSITQESLSPWNDGFGSRLQEFYIRTIDVMSRGLTAYNTEHFLNDALPILKREMVEIFNTVLITIWFGTNDATLEKGPNGWQHIPVGQFTANIINITEQLQAAVPMAKIILMTPSIIDDKQRPGGDRTNEQAGVYAQAVRDAHKKLKDVTLLDLYDFQMKTYPNETERGWLVRDGIHPSSDGNRVLADQLDAVIKKVIPSEMLNTPQVPYWGYIPPPPV